MNFGSEFVYLYEQPDFEFISDEEYERGMNISDSDSSGSDDYDDDVETVDLTGLPMGVESHTGPPRPPPPLLGGPAAPTPSSGLFGLSPARPGVSHSVGFVPPAPPAPAPRTESAGKRLGFLPRRKQKQQYQWKSKASAAIKGDSEDSSKNRKKVRQGDTNIVTVKFDKLISPSGMHAGDPQECSGCSAILSKYSKLEEDGDNKVWVCEFCGRRNTVDIEEEEKPTEPDVTFMMEPALSTTASGPSGLDESLVIFLVDISGSMCVTTEVPGHVELRGDESLRRTRNMNRDRADQYLPNQRRNVTYISRLQSVQAAIDHQLQEMCKEFPNRRVALITFSNEVTVIGDGKGSPMCIAGDKLAKVDTLKSIATEQPVPDAIKTSRQQLGKKLFELEECGPTALGPGLLVATTMASKFRGSKVILCTDGLANVGMGKLDNFKDQTEQDATVKFYDDIAQSAVDSGVAISVITIKGTECKLVEIGKMADKTGGQVNIVDPLKLTQEFSTILANKIIATNVEATMILHKELFFFYEESKESKAVKNIGNVTADSEISFEYGVRTSNTDSGNNDDNLAKPQAANPDVNADKDRTSSPMEVDETKDSDMDTSKPIPPKIQIQQPSTSTSTEPEASGSSHPGGLSEEKELPFQLQIRYTDLEGAKALRVITQTKPVTRDRKKAEKLAKLDVLAAHTAMTSAKMAQDGLYTMSRERALMNQRVAWRNQRDDDGQVFQNRGQYKKAFGKIRSMENYLAERQCSERRTTGRTYSDDEEDEVDSTRMGGAAPPPRTSGSQMLAKGKTFLNKLRKKRSETTEDAGAALILRGKCAKTFFDEEDKK